MNPVVIRTLMILACVILAGIAAYAFMTLPIGAQKKKIKEWLLYAVLEAEKDLGSGTGQVKLRYVYDLFTSKFKFVSVILPFETFSRWVDDVLVEMRQMIETNENVKNLVTPYTYNTSCIGFEIPNDATTEEEDE